MSDCNKVEGKDIYLYKDFNCSIKFQDGSIQRFKFSLKNFSQSPTYEILIDAEKNVAVRDADYLEKRKFLW